MDGLINYGIVKPELAGAFGAGIRAQQDERMQNQLAQQKLAMGQMQQEQAGLQLQDFKRRQSALDQFVAKAQQTGRTGTPKELAQQFYDYAITAKEPQVIMAAQQALLAAKEREDYDADLANRRGPAPTAAPAPAMPTGALGSGTFGIMPETTNALAPAPSVNAMAPAPAPSVNAMAPDAATALQNKIIDLKRRYPSGAANAEIAMLTKELEAKLKESPDLINMERLGYPLTQQGYKLYREAQRTERLLTPEEEAQKLRIAAAGRPAGTTVVLPAQEKAFETELGKEQAGDLIKSRAAARDAVSIIDTVNIGRDIMKSGMITGAGADFLVNLNQGLKTVGIDAGYADAAANSQAFAANMANNVGKLIKQFGAGTGLSNADREYAEKMAGSKITLDPKAINRILEINERAARNVITRHNKDVKGVKTNIPLEVELPPEIKTPSVSVPPAAVAYLRANPTMKSAFDAKYGAGAADRALKGQ